ncbi:MAG: preprotein translocase subunit SecG [Bacteroidetes bacterium]|nr:preprotein translocase subunit SecG [Bacteroidota bacterium]
MFWIVVPLAILLSIALVVMVLMQPSKGGGAGGAFGSLGSSLGSTFGARRTLDFLAKGTTWAAGILGVLCFLANLAIGPSHQSAGEPQNSVTKGKVNASGAKDQPVQPAPGQAQPGAPQGGGQPANVQSTPAHVEAKPVTPKQGGK